MKNLLDINPEYVLTLDGHRYRLLETVGTGGSSLVYKARPTDGVFNDYLIIKEFCPSGFGVERNEDGSIVFPCQHLVRIDRIKDRVYREPEIVGILREDDGNNNPLFLSYSQPMHANNTLYTIIQTESGGMLSSKMKERTYKNLSDICHCILLVLETLEQIHKKGYLHLDVSPDNIFMSDLKVAKLIDYNSALFMSDDPNERCFSFKENYSAPELKSVSGAKASALGPAADLYSVTVIFFELLKGSLLNFTDRIVPLHKHMVFTGNEGIFSGASSSLKNAAGSLVKKGMSYQPELRFQNAAEMRADIEMIIKLAEEKEIVNTPRFTPGYGYFVGRKDELKSIDILLESSGYVFLEGMGGIGKTELAKKYAEEYRAKYDRVQFISYAGSLKSTIGNRLKFHNFDDLYYKNTYGDDALDYIFADKLNILKKHDERTLIIIDNYNVSSDDSFAEFVSGSYKVVFTTRIMRGANSIKVVSMQNMESLRELFYNYCPRKRLTRNDETDIDGIIKFVQGHTMTVMLVAAQINKGEIAPSEMLRRLKNGIPKMRTKISVDKENIDDSERENTMYAHIKCLFSGISEIQKSEIYKFILTNMCLVPYCGLDKKAFYQWVLAKRYKSEEFDDEDYTDLNWLIDRRWIQFGEDSRRVSLHPIVSEIMYEELKPDTGNCEDLIRAYIRRLKSVPQKTYIEQGETAELTEPAIARINDETELAANLMQYAGVNYRLLSDYSKALNCGMRAMKTKAALYGEDSAEVAPCYRLLGDIYNKKDDYIEALEFFIKASTIYKENHSDEHPDVIALYVKIADICFNLTKYDMAMEFYNKALDSLIKNYGRESAQVAEVHANIGRVYAQIGQSGKATETYNKALNIYMRTNHGMDLPLASLYAHMGAFCRSTGAYEKAGEYLNLALDYYMHRYGDKHSETAYIYHHISRLYAETGEHSIALDFGIKAVDIYIRTLGENHVRTAICYEMVGSEYYNLGKYDEALKCYKKAQDTFVQKYGERHTLTASTYDDIGRTYVILGDAERALTNLKKALDAYSGTYTKDNIETAYIYNNIGLIYADTNEHKKAIEYYRVALNAYISNLGRNHQRTAMVCNNIGFSYIFLGKLYKAMDFCKKALAIYLDIYGERHTDTANVYDSLGVAYHKSGNLTKALEYHKKALSVRLALLGAEHKSTAHSYYYAGMVYGELGDSDTALKYYSKALDILQRCFPENQAEIEDIIKNMKKNYNR